MKGGCLGKKRFVVLKPFIRIKRGGLEGNFLAAKSCGQGKIKENK